MIDHLINNNCCSCDCEDTPIVDVESLIVNHISNDDIHVSAEDRSKWNEAAEAISSIDTTVDLSLVEDKIDNINDKLDEHIEDKEVHLSSDDRNKLNQLKSIALEVRDIDLSKYIEKNTLSTINGKRIDQGGNITIETSSSNTKPLFFYTSNVENNDNTYALGTISYDNIKYTIYGLMPQNSSDSGNKGDNSDSLTDGYIYTKAIYKGTDTTQTPSIPVGGQFSWSDYTMLDVPGWFQSPALALNNGSTTFKYIWVSYNTFFKEGDKASTGWTTPQLWYDINSILNKADQNASNIADNVMLSASNALERATLMISGNIEDLKSRLNGAVVRIENIESLGTGTVQAAISGIVKIYKWLEHTGEAPTDYTIIDGYSTVDELNEHLTGVEYFDKFVKIGDTYYQYTANSLSILNLVSSLSGTIGELSERIKTVSESITPDAWIAQAVEQSAEGIKTSAILILKDSITLAVSQEDDRAVLQLGINDGETYTEITSEEIVLNGEVVAKAIKSKELNIDDKTIIKSDGAVQTGIGTDGESSFNIDGTGYVGGGALSWNKEGASFKGTVTATSGSFTGSIQATEFTILGENGLPAMFIATYGYLKEHEFKGSSNFTSSIQLSDVSDTTPIICCKDQNGEYYFIPLTKVQYGGIPGTQPVRNEAYLFALKPEYANSQTPPNSYFGQGVAVSKSWNQWNDKTISSEPLNTRIKLYYDENRKVWDGNNLYTGWVLVQQLPKQYGEDYNNTLTTACTLVTLKNGDYAIVKCKLIKFAYYLEGVLKYQNTAIFVPVVTTRTKSDGGNLSSRRLCVNVNYDKMCIANSVINSIEGVNVWGSGPNGVAPLNEGDMDLINTRSDGTTQVNKTTTTRLCVANPTNNPNFYITKDLNTSVLSLEDVCSNSNNYRDINSVNTTGTAREYIDNDNITLELLTL